MVAVVVATADVYRGAGSTARLAAGGRFVTVESLMIMMMMITMSMTGDCVIVKLQAVTGAFIRQSK